MEIVTEPDSGTAEQARRMPRKLRLLIRDRRLDAELENGRSGRSQRLDPAARGGIRDPDRSEEHELDRAVERAIATR